MTTGPVTAEEVTELAAVVRDVCRRLEPDVIGLHQVPEVFDALVGLERLAGGAVVRMAARYEEAGQWKRNGATSAEDDVARKTGTGTGQARRKLAASKRLGGQAKTDAAVRDGDLSPDQADAALKRPIDQRFADARDAGRFEPHEAYAADVAKHRLLGTSAGDAADRAGGSTRRSNQAVRPDKKVIALIDVDALNRGRVEGDETCEIAGVGPVSVTPWNGPGGTDPPDPPGGTDPPEPAGAPVQDDLFTLAT